LGDEALKQADGQLLQLLELRRLKPCDLRLGLSKEELVFQLDYSPR